VTEKILHAAAHDKTLREFLGEAIKRFPLKQSLEEARDDLRGFVLRSGRIGTKAANMLDRTCNHIGDDIGRAHDFVSGERARIRKKLKSHFDQYETEGPIAPSTFRWKRKDYTFSRRQWELLRVLWNESYVPEREFKRDFRATRVAQVPEGTVLAQVYFDSDARPNTLCQLQRRTQDKLDEYRIALEISRPLRRQLRLIDRLSLTVP
jgi:hypothetical protein